MNQELHNVFHARLTAIQQEDHTALTNDELEVRADELMKIVFDACCPFTLLTAMYLVCHLKEEAYSGREDWDQVETWGARADNYWRMLNEVIELNSDTLDA